MLLDIKEQVMAIILDESLLPEERNQKIDDLMGKVGAIPVLRPKSNQFAVSVDGREVVFDFRAYNVRGQQNVEDNLFVVCPAFKWAGYEEDEEENMPPYIADALARYRQAYIRRLHTPIRYAS